MPNSQPPKNGPTSSLLSRASTLFTSSRVKKEPKASLTITSPVNGVQYTVLEKDQLPQADGGASPPSGNTTPPPPLSRSHSKSSRKSSRHRYSQSVSTNYDLQSLRRSVSLRSITSSHRLNHQRGASTATLALPITQEHPPGSSHSSKSHLHLPNFTKRQKSADNVRDFSESTSPGEVTKLPGGMAAVQYRNTQPGRPPGTSHSMSSLNYPQTNGPVPPLPTAPNGLQNPQTVYQHILDTCSKRISTLDYLRKAHEGRVYWFNTLLFTKPDLLKFSYFQPAKLARRATNYLLLGFSLPTILDLNSQTPTEYLRALTALLIEFEQYQTLHPPDGKDTSSLSRARIPHMFKRTPGKSRRHTSASEALLPSSMSTTSAGSDATSNTNGTSGTSVSFAQPVGMASMLPDTLLPTESYTHLLTPSLPFDPDFFETFATLCDVLIDCYTKVTQLINSPDACVGGVGELFAKADARVRKVIVAGVVREFEERCRDGVRSEVAGVGKVVLGGLM